MTVDGSGTGHGGRPLCGAQKRQGEPGETCTQPAGWGTDHLGYGRCRKHGGNTETHVLNAQKQQAEAAVATYGLSIDISPQEALLQEVRWTAGHVAWLRQRVQETEAEKLTVGVAEQRVDPSGGKTTVVKTAPNVWLDLYDRERKHLVAVCTAALRAGVEERTVRLAEQQGQVLVGVIRAILTDLNLTPDQEAAVPEIVPRHLRAIGGAA